MSDTTNLLAKRMQRVQSSAIRDLLRHAKIPGMISLAGGIPAPDLLDLEGLALAAEQAVGSGESDIYQYGLTEGEAVTREAIAELMTGRGINADPDQLLITTGSQQALDIVAKVFLDEGDAVLVEDPTYLAALQVFNMAGARSVAARFDDMDAVTAALERERPKLIYVVPNFSNPAGATLSQAQRERLIDLAVEHHTLIVEDDPYGELRYSGEAVPSLYQLAQARGIRNRVIYISSFSKILAPGLRLGWCLPPAEYASHLALAKQSLDLHSSTFSQHIATRYLKSGRLAARVAILRDAYRARRDALATAIEQHLPGQIDYNLPEGGMFLWGRLASGMNARELLKVALEEKVMFVPGDYFFSGNPDPQALRLSFSMITPEKADEALRRLALAIERVGRAVA